MKKNVSNELKRSFNRQMKSVRNIGMKFHFDDRFGEFQYIVNEVFGYNQRITKTKINQIKELRNAYFMMKQVY